MKLSGMFESNQEKTLPENQATNTNTKVGWLLHRTT